MEEEQFHVSGVFLGEACRFPLLSLLPPLFPSLSSSFPLIFPWWYEIGKGGTFPWYWALMAAGEEKIGDFYAVMGLDKECSVDDLRTSYKKLAMRWHPDRCSASKNSKFVEEAKTKFQEIQEAYSVLSDSNKRFLYDVGVYDNDDDEDENGMGDFLGEMAAMMSKTKPSENKQESFEDLQELFMEMFQGDMNSSFGFSSNGSTNANGSDQSSASSSNNSPSPFTYCSGSSGGAAPQNLKRDSADMTSGKASSSPESFAPFNSGDNAFCFGMTDSGSSTRSGSGGNGGSSRRRSGQKQKVSSRHDVSSRDTSGAGISAS